MSGKTGKPGGLFGSKKNMRALMVVLLFLLLVIMLMAGNPESPLYKQLTAQPVAVQVLAVAVFAAAAIALMIGFIRTKPGVMEDPSKVLKEHSVFVHKGLTLPDREKVKNFLKAAGFAFFEDDKVMIGIYFYDAAGPLTKAQYLYSYVVLPCDMTEEEFLKEYNEKIREMTAKHMKGKRNLGYIIASPIFCYWGSNPSEEVLEKCRCGIDKAAGKLLATFSYAVDPEAGILYYAEYLNKIEDEYMISYHKIVEWMERLYHI